MPEQSRDAIDELQEMHEMGISFIQLQEQPPPQVWEAIEAMQFKVYGLLNIDYPVISTFARPDSTLITSIEHKVSDYLSHPSVKAIGLFRYGAIHRADFRNAVQPFVTQLQAAGAAVYFISSQLPEESIKADFFIYDLRLPPQDAQQINVPNHPAVGGYQFSPQEELSNKVFPFKQLTESVFVSQVPLFLSSEWLFGIIDKYPELQSILHSLTTDPEAAFPVPREADPEQSPPVVPIVTLLLAWGVMAFLYHSSPLYRKSAFRYFIAHKFFIQDIFSRKIRSSVPALTLLFLNALLLSASVYAAFLELFSPLARNGFFHYLPFSSVETASLHIFSGAFVGILILSLVCILWLFFTQGGVRSLTQVTILYAWPLQINLLTTTAAITLFSAGGPVAWILVFTALSLVIQYLSFILASLDATRPLRGKKALYRSLTLGMYLLISGAFVGGMVYGTKWREVLDLLLKL